MSKYFPFIETDRLILRPPEPQDAAAIFSRYAGDVEVTRFLAWPRHRTLDDSRQFVQFSDTLWQRWPGGPFLIELRADGKLLGSSGYTFETEERASLGYVLARDAWGMGFASEVVNALVEHAPILGLQELTACCHVDHRASARVLEKCGFDLQREQSGCVAFPNLPDTSPQPILFYSRRIL